MIPWQDSGPKPNPESRLRGGVRQGSGALKDEGDKALFVDRVPAASRAADRVLTSLSPFAGRIFESVQSVERTGSVVKVKASIRRMCNQCQVVRRKGKVRVICKANPKHKQVQG